MYIGRTSARPRTNPIANIVASFERLSGALIVDLPLRSHTFLALAAVVNTDHINFIGATRSRLFPSSARTLVEHMSVNYRFRPLNLLPGMTVRSANIRSFADIGTRPLFGAATLPRSACSDPARRCVVWRTWGSVVSRRTLVLRRRREGVHFMPLIYSTHKYGGTRGGP